MAALQFVVWFVQEDLDGLRGPELRALARRVQAFIAREEVGWWADREMEEEYVPWHPRDDRATLRAMQTDLRPLLEAFAIPRVGRDGRRRRRFAVVGPLPLKYWVVEDQARTVVLADGAARVRFLYETVRVFEQAGTQRLSMCKDAPRCMQLFVKVTKKEFCSTRCQSRYYMRKRRQREREQDPKQRGGQRGKTTRTR